MKNLVKIRKVNETQTMRCGSLISKITITTDPKTGKKKGEIQRSNDHTFHKIKDTGSVIAEEETEC